MQELLDCEKVIVVVAVILLTVAAVDSTVSASNSLGQSRSAIAKISRNVPRTLDLSSLLSSAAASTDGRSVSIASLLGLIYWFLSRMPNCFVVIWWQDAFPLERGALGT
jgi:hypothetical protein